MLGDLDAFRTVDWRRLKEELERLTIPLPAIPHLALTPLEPGD